MLAAHVTRHRGLRKMETTNLTDSLYREVKSTAAAHGLKLKEFIGLRTAID